MTNIDVIDVIVIFMFVMVFTSLYAAGELAAIRKTIRDILAELRKRKP